MFTGIIETIGIVKEVFANGSNLSFWIETPMTKELKVDQSVCHNGACLTVEEVEDTKYKVTAVLETLQKTNIRNWKVGSQINLERSLQLNARLDGHLVQGHTDTTAICSERKEKDGSWVFQFEYPKKFAPLIIEKGSICVNGISLTAFDVKKKSFRVTIIPYTYEHTNIKEIQPDEEVNLEFDMIGKYLLRSLSLRS